MSTLGEIRDTCVKDILTRADDYRNFGLIAVRNAYLSICNKVPFPELQRLSTEIAVTANDPEVSIATLDPPLAGIISIRYYNAASGTYHRLVPRDGRLYDAQSTAVSSKPYSYARGRTGDILELNPRPSSSSDTLRVRYWSMPDITDPNDLSELASHQIVIPIEWERLLTFEALYELYHYDNSLESMQKAQMLVMKSPLPRMGSTKKQVSYELGIIPRLWNDLLETKTIRENLDADYSINPRHSRYSHG